MAPSVRHFITTSRSSLELTTARKKHPACQHVRALNPTRHGHSWPVAGAPHSQTTGILASSSVLLSRRSRRQAFTSGGSCSLRMRSNGSSAPDAAGASSCSASLVERTLDTCAAKQAGAELVR